MSLYSLLTTGNLVGEEFCYHQIPEKLDPFDEETFSRSSTRFYAVCTDVETGRPVYVRIRRMAQGVRYLMASASMPLVSRIVEEGGRKLLDGGRPPAYVARYCLISIEAALEGMTKALLERYGPLPLVYAGGVMSSSVIRPYFERKYGGYFAEPAFSSDNAAGIALLAAVSAGESVR